MTLRAVQASTNTAFGGWIRTERTALKITVRARGGCPHRLDIQRQLDLLILTSCRGLACDLLSPSVRVRTGFVITNRLVNVATSLRVRQPSCHLRSAIVFRCPADRTNDAAFAGRIVKGTTYVWETTSCGGAGGKPIGGGIWNNGSGLKLRLFRCDGILTIEPEESRSILWNDGAVDYIEDETSHHNKGGVIGCYGGSAERMPFAVWKQQQSTFPSRLNCSPNAADGRGQ